MSPRVCLALPLALALTLAAQAAAPPAKGDDAEERMKALGDWFNKAEKWLREDDAAAQKRIAEDYRHRQQQMRPYLLALQSEGHRAANKVGPALKSQVEAVAAFQERSRAAKGLTPAESAAYREAVLQLGLKFLAAGEQDQAALTAEAAWRVHERLHAAVRLNSTDRARDGLRVAVAVGAILNQAERHAAAHRHARHAAALVEQLPERERRAEHNPLLAELWLLQGQLAADAGNHRGAVERGGRALEALRRRDPAGLDLVVPLTSLARSHAALWQVRSARTHLAAAGKILDACKPLGEPLRAEVHRLRGHLYFLEKDLGPAVREIELAHQSYLKLFPADEFPKSHPALIQALVALADLLDEGRQHGRAAKMAREAWRQALRRYPRTHRQRVAVRLCLGRCLGGAAELAAAERELFAALAEARQLSPGGDALTALCQLHLGAVLERRGRHESARSHYEAARQAFAKLAPDDHPRQAEVLNALGRLALTHGDPAAARAAFAAALHADQQQVSRLALAAAEIEDLAFTAPRAMSLHGYLCATRGRADADAEAFGWVMAASNVGTRLAEARREALPPDTPADPRLEPLRARLVDVCARLRRVHTSAEGEEERPALLQERERLLKELSDLRPEPNWRMDWHTHGPAQLAEALPARTAFVQWVRYVDRTGPQPAAHYAAFVVRRGEKLVRVELGPAATIDAAVAGWREAAAGWRPLASSAAQAQQWADLDRHGTALRKAAWEPLAALLPRGPALLILAPDGDLAQFPFAALPGGAAGAILLEEYTIAYAPGGPYLLERLRQLDRPFPLRRAFLAVGAVGYGAPRQKGAKVEYAPLRGTREAIDLLRRLPAWRVPDELTDGDATVEALVRRLPRAGDAHIATHGFFDAGGLEKQRQQADALLRDWTPGRAGSLRAAGAGQRFPLIYVGLALAGANDPAAAGPHGGILTGEAICRLDLSGLWSVVLSACETGLGKDTPGEGLQGLQRSFHLGGCPNVIASLWQVPDDATRALMGEYYRQQWRRDLPTLEALRQAQLAVYRGRVRVVGGPTRGMVEEPLQGEAAAAVERPTAAPRSRAHPQLWAAFVHSGISDRLLTQAPPEDDLPSEQAGSLWTWLGLAGATVLAGLLPVGLWWVLNARRGRGGN